MVSPTTLVRTAPHVPGSTVTFPASDAVVGGVHPEGIVSVTGRLPALFAARNTNAKFLVLPGGTNREAGVTVNV